MKRILFSLFLCFISFNFLQAESIYSVQGIYIEVPEDIALDESHYIEYDDRYFIKRLFEEEMIFIEIVEKISSRLYQIKIKPNDITAYIYLRLPDYLMKGETGKILLSNIVDSDLIIE